MTAIDELRILHKQFPNSEQLAVSGELNRRYEAEIVTNARFFGVTPEPFRWIRPDRVGYLDVQPLPLVFRNARLVLTRDTRQETAPKLN